MKAVAYYRVSTDKQGQSGLGLEAQREAIRVFLNGRGWPPIAEFTEIESGKKADRPELMKALEACRLYKATLVIAKLDRLARNAAFLLSLRDAGVDFVAVDMPDANRLTVGIMALVAEDEAERISQRTKAALAAAKARGRTLGGFRGYRPSTADRSKGVASRQARADAKADLLAPIVRDLQGAGTSSLAGIAKALNDRGITTDRGAKWHPTSVARLLARMGS
ncbi:recombinase family protein [Microvirga sp. CF3016]|uniref:recombinase family protein n=1 Tax=Microvirga sp. CF3016 TaxID=3110181 RepID=UPI002E765577|nr:recombinase family protein [Microvirga sp. CF3016]MEE1611859.1 recombinase family protein [Microvirga sp. CF3016]